MYYNNIMIFNIIYILKIFCIYQPKKKKKNQPFKTKTSFSFPWFPFSAVCSLQATQRLLPKVDPPAPSTQATRQAFVERKRCANNLAAAFSEARKPDDSQNDGSPWSRGRGGVSRNKMET